MGPLDIFLSLPFFSSSFRKIFLGLFFLAILGTKIKASAFSSVFTTNDACSSVVYIFGSYLFVLVGSVYECLSTERRAIRNEDAAIISISLGHRQLLSCEYLSSDTFERPRPQVSCHGRVKWLWTFLRRLSAGYLNEHLIQHSECMKNFFPTPLSRNLGVFHKGAWWQISKIKICK